MIHNQLAPPFVTSIVDRFVETDGFLMEDETGSGLSVKDEVVGHIVRHSKNGTLMNAHPANVDYRILFCSEHHVFCRLIGPFIRLWTTRKWVHCHQSGG